MRGQDHVVDAAQRRLQRIVVALGLFREHVDRGTAEVPAAQGGGKRIDVDHAAARGIDQVRARLHPRDLRGADHPARGRGIRHMQGDHVGFRQQLVEVDRSTRVAERELGLDVVEQHLHAQCFGQHADLGADVAVTDDAQGLAARLVAARRRLAPAAAVALRGLLRDPAQQHDGFRQHQFGDAAGIGIGRVEYRDAGQLGGFEVDLVGADAEAADRQQAPGLGQHLGGQLGARADADEMRIGDRLAQFVLGQRLGVGDDVAVAGGAEGLDGIRADAFEQQDLDVLLRIRGFLGRHVGGGQCRVHRTMPDAGAKMRQCVIPIATALMVAESCA